MSNLLTGLDQLIANIAGPLLFSDASLVRVALTADGRGGHTEAETDVACKALVTEYSLYSRTALGIPDTDRKVLILGAGLEPPPMTGNLIVIDGYRWKVVQTTRDPAKAVYDCQCRPAGVDP